MSTLHTFIDLAGAGALVTTALFAAKCHLQARDWRNYADQVGEYLSRTHKRLGEAIEEADTHKAALDVVNTQRTQALEKARQSNLARKAARVAKEAADDSARRDNTLKALPNLNLRPRDEVVADVIKGRTGV